VYIYMFNPCRSDPLQFASLQLSSSIVTETVSGRENIVNDLQYLTKIRQFRCYAFLTQNCN